MKFAFAASLAAVAALASACSYPPPPPPPGPATGLTPPPAPGAFLAGQDCFYTRDIRNHTIGDPRTMYIEVAGKGTYRLGMSGACLTGAISSDPIITQQPPGSALVCRPIDMDLSIARSGGGFTTRCIVDSIVRLTPAQRAALPDRIRP